MDMVNIMRIKDTVETWTCTFGTLSNVATNIPHYRLLFRHFSQRQEVLRSFGQVQLLVSDSDVKSYKQIKDDLDDLRLLVEKSELWVYKAVKQEDKKVGGKEFGKHH